MKKILLIPIIFSLLLPILTACGRGTQTPPPPIVPVQEVFDTPTGSRAFSPTPLGTYEHTPETTAFAEHTFSPEMLTQRSGYILVPTMYSLSGVDELSSFFLITPFETIPNDIRLTIDGQPAPRIEQESGDTFHVTPAIPLSSNSVYIFRLSRYPAADITWAFQTATRFDILSTLPRHESTVVPVRTGIEIDFSLSGDTNISDFFTIYPEVPGRFIHRGTTAIFMPTNPLSYASVYTVTIAPGVTHRNSGAQSTTALTFSFETEPEGQNWGHGRDTSIHFSANYLEFPTFAAPSVNFWLNYPHGRARPAIDISVYQLDSHNRAIQAVNSLVNLPRWAHFHEPEYISTSGLANMYTATITERQEGQQWNEGFTLSQTLGPGFYVLNATVNGHTSQVVFQITDMAVQIIADNNMVLVWANDMHTGQPAYGALANNIPFSNYGIAVLEEELDAGDYIIVSAPDGTETVVFIHHAAFQHTTSWGGGWSSRSWGWGWDWPVFPQSSGSDRYWSALQLDRSLFQRADSVNLWGFVQNRAQPTNINHVTATITQQTWWWEDTGNDILLRQIIPVNYGAFSATIDLPHLDPGSYILTIYHADHVIATTWLSIQDYVTPPYQLTLTPSQDAAFLGDEITFTARVAFFEGTPVPDLSLSYNSWGGDLQSPGGGRATTDADGIVQRSIVMQPTNARAQGQTTFGFNAEATLPEIGWTHSHASVRVFINDIQLRARADHEDGNATLSVNVNNITIDRINDGTATGWNDFLCAPVQGQVLDVDIYRIFWVPERIGERYCFILRQVVPRYTHHRRYERIDRFQLTTDAEGYVSHDFTVPNRDNESYEARINTIDGNGRRIRHNVFVGPDWWWFHNMLEEGAPFLYGARPSYEGYDIGDTVELAVMIGAEPLTQGNILFVKVQDNILGYQIGRNTLEFTFEEQHAPNVSVIAFHFNGHTYHVSGRLSEQLHFNSSTRNLNISMETCQEYYRPGDTVTVTISVSDESGAPQTANINFSLVDEALFALMDQQVNTLGMLWGTISDRLRFSLATHRTFISDGIASVDDAGGMRQMRDGLDTWTSAATGAPAAEMAEDSAVYGFSLRGGTAETVRQRFEDTAYFRSLRTNANGTVTFTFVLPDNITSWRATISAISQTLYAGNTVENIRVTNPMFLNYTLNSVFLTGDVPYIGVNAFGTALSGGEEIRFEVWCYDNPQNLRTATGTAFARTNIPLWEMANEGDYSLVIRATVGNHTDAVRHFYQVVSSHRMVDMASFYEVAPGTVFATNPLGLTNITFTCHGRGQFAQSLMNMRWTRGARIEELIAQREATRLLQANFDIPLWGTNTGFDVADYQTADGGIAMLPYSNSDLRTTVLLMPFILDEINVPALRGYLQEAGSADSLQNRILALYGLAMLGDPVLLELQEYAQVATLSVRNMAYVGLGLAALGEVYAAAELFENRVVPSIQATAPYYRINIGNRTEILDATFAAALLAAEIGAPQASGLFHYTTRYHTCILTQRLEQLTFIVREIENYTATMASITYTFLGEEVTRDLSDGQSFTLRIPAQNISDFVITATTGQVGAVSIVRTPLEEVEPIDNGITVTRHFYRAGTNQRATTFAQDEIVRVQITINYGTSDITGSYVITDILPAGLVHVPHSARFGDLNQTYRTWAHVATEGQRITFFDFNSRFRSNRTYFYYARVINPGTFTAEGVMVQSVGVREYLTVGESAVITIQP